jgi:hypothetical protein
MNNQFDELTKTLAQSVRRHSALKKFGVGLAGMALALLLALPSAAGDPTTQTSTILDSAGDALFPYDLYGAPVPPFLDVVAASVTLTRGVFHFEIKMNSAIPANADPGFVPSVNHLGTTVGVLTDQRTASHFKFFGQTDGYYFNFLVGALYSASDSGIGLNLGWSGFLIDTSTFTAIEIPLQIRGDTFVFETSAASLGNPNSFNWVVASECDPTTVTEEKTKSGLLVDFVPDHGYATWPSP